MKTALLLKNYASLLDGLYGSALGEGGLVEFLSKLGTLLHCHSASMFITTRVAGDIKSFPSSWNLDESSIQLYQEYYSTKDLALQKGLSLPTEKFYATTLFPIEDQRRYKRSEIYQDYNRFLDVHQIAGAFVPVDNQHLMMVAFYRNRSTTEFCAEELELLDTLVPHFCRYVQIQTRLEHIQQQCDGVTQASERFSLPFLLINAEGKVTFISRSARDKIDNEPQLSLRNDRMTIKQPKANQQLQRHILNCLSEDLYLGHDNGCF